MRPQTQMLLKCIEIIKQDKLNQKDGIVNINLQAFTQLLDWIAVKLSYEVQVVTPPFQGPTHDSLAATFDVDLLKADLWDWFGEAAVSLGLQADIAGLELNRSETTLWTTAFSRDTASKLGKIEDNLVLDPDTGTGRLMMAHSQWKDQIIFYGVESNKISYRVALLNATIYGFNAFILNGDSTRHSLNIDSKNWLSANQWNPLAFDDLLEK